VIKFLTNKKIPLDQLETFPGNPNIGDVPRILESLRSNGVFRALIVRKEGNQYTIMAGNHTKAAMVEHGAGRCEREIKHLEDLDDVGNPPCGLCHDGWDARPRCEIYECDDQTAIRINLADNRIPEFSHRDDQALAELLMSLEDLSGSGYTTDDLRLYLPQEPPELEEMAEQYGEPEVEPVWPTLTFKVSPAARDKFLELTEDADDPGDPASRFLYLISKAHG
jgi:hypothetical protein